MKSPHTSYIPAGHLLYFNSRFPNPRSELQYHLQERNLTSCKTMRQSKATKQSKLMRFISSPIRTLTKPKNFYMRSLEDCGAKVGYGGGGTGVGGYTASQVPHLPRSFSVNSSSSNDDEDLRQLLRTSSSKRNKDAEKENNEAALSDMHRRGRSSVDVRQPTMSNGKGMRSYSVGLKMGRIDEERASTFEEDEVDVKADFYTRSRSYAVNMRNARFV